MTQNFARFAHAAARSASDERCLTHRHLYPTRRGDNEQTPKHDRGARGYETGYPWCSVVEEEWHDRIDLDTMDCEWGTS